MRKLGCFVLLFLVLWHETALASEPLRVSYQDGTSTTIPFTIGNLPQGTEFFTDYSFELSTALQANSVEQLCDVITEVHVRDEVHRITLVLAQIGQCTIEKKLENLQSLGYDGLIVYLPSDSSYDVESYAYDFQQDGRSSLPVLVISFEDASGLLDRMENKGEDISAQFMLEPIKKTSNGTFYLPIDLWGTPHSNAFAKFIGDIMQCESTDKTDNMTELPCLRLMEDSQLQFEPHYLVLKKNNETDETNCFGDYCSPDPDGDGILSGQNETFQTVIQKCVFKEYSVGGWFRYTFRYIGFCGKRATQVVNDIQCSNNTMAGANLDPERVHKCIAEATASSRIEVLEEDIAKASQLSVTLGEIPQIFIGGYLYPGIFQFSNIKLSLCSVFQVLRPDNLPIACKPSEGNHSSIAAWFLEVLVKSALIVFAVFGLLVLFIFFFFKGVRKTNLQIQKEIIDQKVREALLIPTSSLTIENSSLSSAKNTEMTKVEKSSI